MTPRRLTSSRNPALHDDDLPLNSNLKYHGCHSNRSLNTCCTPHKGRERINIDISACRIAVHKYALVHNMDRSQTYDAMDVFAPNDEFFGIEWINDSKRQRAFRFRFSGVRTPPFRVRKHFDLHS